MSCWTTTYHQKKKYIYIYELVQMNSAWTDRYLFILHKTHIGNCSFSVGGPVLWSAGMTRSLFSDHRLHLFSEYDNLQWTPWSPAGHFSVFVVDLIPAIFFVQKNVCVFESKWFCIITVVVWCHLLHVLYLNSVVFSLPSIEFCIIKKSDKWSKRDLAWKMESVNNDIRNLKDSFSEQMMRVGLITSQRCSLS